MPARRIRFAAGAALAALAAAGCGLGPGPESEGEATLTVTRDYGSVVLREATVSDPSESETVIRLLDRETDLTTRYGGGFVQSIDGLAGGLEDGRSVDWFFYVNGIESEVGSAEVAVRGGDRVWWDHRDWTDAMRVPAVVGSWPEPFLQAAAGEDAEPVALECRDASAPCDEVADALEAAGAETGSETGDSPRALVGTWSRIGDDEVARLLAEGPGVSGVFARFSAGGRRLVTLDERADPVSAMGAGAGLVAALRDGEGPPTWLITGTDEAGVERAAEALDPAALANRYAVAVGDGAEPEPLPVGAGG